jgi:hypothetical protein
MLRGTLRLQGGCLCWVFAGSQGLGSLKSSAVDCFCSLSSSFMTGFFSSSLVLIVGPLGLLSLKIPAMADKLAAVEEGTSEFVDIRVGGMFEGWPKTAVASA